MEVIKRDGKVVEFRIDKIITVITKSGVHETDATKIANIVTNNLIDKNKLIVDIEEIQDEIITIMKENKFLLQAEAYSDYRQKRNQIRSHGAKLMKNLATIIKDTNEGKKDNANIDGDAPMGKMLHIGASASRAYLEYMQEEDFIREHQNGAIHIHDSDFYFLTTTCLQIDLAKLFKNGFNTGNGHIREPQRIGSYASLACIAIQSNQNDQHGGQSIPALDYYLAEGVMKSFKKNLDAEIYSFLMYVYGYKPSTKIIKEIKETQVNLIRMAESDAFSYIKEKLGILLTTGKTSTEWQKIIYERALERTEADTFQAMESFIFNLNTMHCRAGAQVPFSSINYGTDTSSTGRMVIKNILLALEKGMGNSETPIFPIHIFKVKEGINYEKGSPNHDLFLLACNVASKRLFPNFSFLDASFNKKYLKEGDINTEVAYMGCRTRVLGNVYDPSNEITTSRGNLSFTSINLPRMAIEANGNIEFFYSNLNYQLDMVAKQLLHRMKLISRKKVYNFPFLMNEGNWLKSENLNPNDEIEEVIKHGTLAIGFIGLAETLILLYGEHHGQSEVTQQKGLEIIGHMRQYCDRISQEQKLNYTLLATPAEGLSGRFTKMDKERYGIIKDVTDKEYYTNSFHLPVSFRTTIYNKLSKEAPYHNLCNAGHISYVELEGEVQKNPEVIMKVVKAMKELDIGYGSINYPVDYDSVCKYNGIIGDICPKCNREEGEIPFRRIRRITGYLVGDLDRFNKAKLAEVRDRVKHSNNSNNLKQ